AGMDVIMEGLLYLQGKTWRKMWTVLYKPSSTGVGRLELYTVPDNHPVTEQWKTSWHKAQEKKVVRLSDCLSVSPAPKESCPPGCTAFYLNTMQCSYTLASSESQKWLNALCCLAFQVPHISPLVQLSPLCIRSCLIIWEMRAQT
uniref:PH domain-containing protein n=1 Tax=Mola mola TaxID=94237 RepID=A0A3Q3WBB1_MOLML